VFEDKPLDIVPSKGSEGRGGGMKCPCGHGPMELRKQIKTTTFRGVELHYEAESYVCPVCGLEVATVEQAARIQRAIIDACKSIEEV